MTSTFGSGYVVAALHHLTSICLAVLVAAGLFMGLAALCAPRKGGRR